MQTKQQTITAVVSSPSQMQQNVRVLTSTSQQQPQQIHVLSSNQTVRLATQPTVSGTMIRTNQGTIQTVQATSSGQQIMSTGQTAQVGGKQVIIHHTNKSIPVKFNTTGSQPHFVTLVKTSKGMTVQTVPQTVNVMQKPGGSQGTTQLVQQGNILHTQGAQVLNAAATTNKTAVVSGNVVKLMPSTTVGNKQILVKNSNMIQMGKVGPNMQGKPTIVITNKAGQQIRTNQQIIVVTTTPQMRTVQGSGIVTSASGNIVNLQSTQMINTVSSANVVQGGNQVKMIRGLQSNTGKPITLTMPMGMQGAKMQQTQGFMPQKTLTIGGKALTVQLAGAGGSKTVTILPAGQSGQMGGSGGQQKKIIVVPQGKFIQQGQQIKTVQVSSASGQIMQVQDVTGQLDHNSIDINDMIEQTDGLNDVRDFRRCDEDEEETFDSKKLSMRKRYSFVRNHGMFKAKRRVKPRYMRLGLYGGAPTPPRDTSNTESADTIEKIDGITPEEALEALEQSDSIMNETTDQPSNITDDSANITLHVSGNDTSDALHQMSTTSDDNTTKLETQSQPGTDHIKEEDEQKFDSSKDAVDMMDAQDIESNISASTLYKPKEDEGVVVMKQEQPKPEEEKPKISLDQVKTEEELLQLQLGSSGGPSETETEAANILTTIKSGELIANQQQCFDLLNQFETSTQALEHSGIIQKIEEDPSKTSEDAGAASGNFLVTDDDIFKHFTSSGPLDALASAALQASTNQQLATSTVKTTTPTTPGNKPFDNKQKQGKGIPKEEVCK